MHTGQVAGDVQSILEGKSETHRLPNIDQNPLRNKVY